MHCPLLVSSLLRWNGLDEHETIFGSLATTQATAFGQALLAAQASQDLELLPEAVRLDNNGKRGRPQGLGRGNQPSNPFGCQPGGGPRAPGKDRRGKQLSSKRWGGSSSGTRPAYKS